MTTKVLVKRPDRSESRAATSSSAGAWRSLGWFGGILAFVGLADVLLVFYPARFGDPTWEFGAVDAAVSTLPLLVLGLAGLMASAVARGRLLQVRVVSAFAWAIGIAIVLAYVMYITTAPLALRVSPPEVVAGIHKSIIRVSIMAITFGLGFLIAGLLAWRSVAAPSQ